MLWSRPRGKTKVEESIRIEPSDQRSEFPSEKLVDTMNFPHKFNAFTAIAFWIVLLMLCGHSRAAPAVRYKKCTMDYECNQGEFCLQNAGASYCAPCFDCYRYNREPSRRCARLRTDCGPCLPGFGELGSHCRRLVKETVTSYYAKDQTLKYDQGPKLDQPEGFSRWLVVPAVSVVVAIGMVVGVVGQMLLLLGKCAAGGAIEVINENGGELDENSVDLEQFAGNDIHNNDPIDINENQQNNQNAMDHNNDYHLNLHDNNDQHLNEDDNNDPQVNVNNNNGHHMDIDQDQIPNALQDFWQVPQDPFEIHPEMNDQVVPDTDQINYLDLQQGLQIFGGDLVQIFDDEMDNFHGCG